MGCSSSSTKNAVSPQKRSELGPIGKLKPKALPGIVIPNEQNLKGQWLMVSTTDKSNSSRTSTVEWVVSLKVANPDRPQGKTPSAHTKEEEPDNRESEDFSPEMPTAPLQDGGFGKKTDYSTYVQKVPSTKNQPVATPAQNSYEDNTYNSRGVPEPQYRSNNASVNYQKHDYNQLSQTVAGGAFKKDDKIRNFNNRDVKNINYDILETLPAFPDLLVTSLNESSYSGMTKKAMESTTAGLSMTKSKITETKVKSTTVADPDKKVIINRSGEQNSALSKPQILPYSDAIKKDSTSSVWIKFVSITENLQHVKSTLVAEKTYPSLNTYNDPKIKQQEQISSLRFSKEGLNFYKLRALSVRIEIYESLEKRKDENIQFESIYINEAYKQFLSEIETIKRDAMVSLMCRKSTDSSNFIIVSVNDPDDDKNTTKNTLAALEVVTDKEKLKELRETYKTDADYVTAKLPGVLKKVTMPSLQEIQKKRWRKKGQIEATKA